MMSQSEPQRGTGVDPVVSNTRPQNADLDECFERHSKVAEQAKAEYIEVYRQMLQELSTEHLEIFAKILLEREGLTLDKEDELIESLRKALLEQLKTSLERFWVDSNVVNSIASLEMLKEKFNDSKDRNWNMQSKTAEERTLPIRMRFKEMRVRYLQKQLQFQSAQLEQILKKNSVHREHIQQVTQQRIYLRDTMEKSTMDFKQMHGELLNMQQELLELSHTTEERQDTMH